MHSTTFLTTLIAFSGALSAASASSLLPRANKKANEFTSGNWYARPQPNLVSFPH